VSNFRLNLPTDIPWERICVTEDMIDPRICDARMPAKWQTSMAVFKYRPEDEDQLYPNYVMTYLKVTATITGYQPLDQEIQGQIDWDGVDVSTIPGLTDLLNSYNPCHGAILQVAVGPVPGRDLPLDEYPFFMDFEPKKRELYELATDTKEKQSRSIESLNITKSAGSTQSMEILDIDQGGGGFGAQASYAGTGGGFSYTAPNGQWGTKRINADESLSSRSSDVGQEKRETFSYSTQLSQMYHLLDSYHIGTNRAVFFVQPRPHTLEEPSGFVRGPRPVEGIQEFFLVVAQLKDQDDFCVSLRLDTSHITTTPILDYDRKSEATSIATASAPVASDHDIPAERIVGARACFFDCWDVHYQCYRTERNDNVTYAAPAGYVIEGYNNLINESSHGWTSVSITPNNQTLSINVHAEGHKCYEGSEVCIDCPDEIQAWAGSARRQVQVNLVSTTPTKQVGEEQVLMITTRGLCCCASAFERYNPKEYVVGIKAIPRELQPRKSARVALARSQAYGTMQPAYATMQHTSAAGASEFRSAEYSQARKADDCAGCAGKAADDAADEPAGYTIRQANELGRYIRTESIRNLNDPLAKPTSFMDTDFFVKQLENRVVQSRRGQKMLEAPASSYLPKEAVARLAKFLKRDDDQTVTLRDAWTMRGSELADVAGLDQSEIRRARLGSLGVRLREQEQPDKPDYGQPGKEDDKDHPGKHPGQDQPDKGGGKDRPHKRA